jgi:hypothetical protein
MVKTRLFVSFDFDNDRILRDFTVGQAKLAGSPFEVSDYSLKEAAKQSLWETKARNAIIRADQFVVMLGPKTRSAPGVRREVAIAVELGAPRFQIIGYPHGSPDWSVPSAGRTYRWNWDNLKKLLAPERQSFAQWFLGS